MVKTCLMYMHVDVFCCCQTSGLAISFQYLPKLHINRAYCSQWLTGEEFSHRDHSCGNCSFTTEMGFLQEYTNHPFDFYWFSLSCVEFVYTGYMYEYLCASCSLRAFKIFNISFTIHLIVDWAKHLIIFLQSFICKEKARRVWVSEWGERRAVAKRLRCLFLPHFVQFSKVSARRQAN